MFSQASVILSTGGACVVKGGCVWQRGGMHGKRGMHGEGGKCMARGGGMHGRGCAWQETATAADGTHSTGMHSC